MMSWFYRQPDHARVLMAIFPRFVSLSPPLFLMERVRGTLRHLLATLIGDLIVARCDFSSALCVPG